MTSHVGFGFGFGILLCVAACETDSDPPSVQISDAAIQGCRKPGDPGCDTCCRVNAETCNCWTGANSSEPWFNASEACSSEPAACARCSERDEQTLRETAPKVVDCDCTALAGVIDPCFAPQGCACQCALYTAAKASCSDP